MMIAGGVIGGKRTEVAFNGMAINTSSPINTFNATRDLGAEDPTRQILVLVYGSNANVVFDTNFTTHVNVAGVAATRVYQPGSSDNTHYTAWITPRMDSGGPTGTSGEYQIRRTTGNGFGTVLFAAFAAYRLRTGIIDAVSGSGNNVPAAVAIDLASGGVLTCMSRALDPHNFTWTGADEVFEGGGGVGLGIWFGAALLNRTAGTTGHVVTVDSANQFDNLFAVSWR